MSQIAALGGTTATSATFTRDLKLGDTGSDVLALQVWLNGHGYPLDSSGPGSPGNETDFFGTLTYNALVKFQAGNGVPATGYFGPLTRAAIASL